VDIALPVDRIEEFVTAASVRGFERPSQPEGRWPKLVHMETGIEVDVLPEGGRPGTASRPAPTAIPHPRSMGARAGRLNYILLPALIELKLAAGRSRDEADIVELIRSNPRLVVLPASRRRHSSRFRPGHFSARVRHDSHDFVDRMGRSLSAVRTRLHADPDAPARRWQARVT
jgi:hypothetical protein